MRRPFHGAGTGFTLIEMLVALAIVAAVLASIGAVVGLVAALGASRLMASLLYGLSPYDPASLAASCVFTLIVAVAASYFPARRATRVDPVVALRQE